MHDAGLLGQVRKAAAGDGVGRRGGQGFDF
jgi:hypothetical protein